MQKYPVSPFEPSYDVYDGAEALDNGKTLCVAINKFAYKFTVEDAESMFEDIKNFLNVRSSKRKIISYAIESLEDSD